MDTFFVVSTIVGLLMDFLQQGESRQEQAEQHAEQSVEQSQNQAANLLDNYSNYAMEAADSPTQDSSLGSTYRENLTKEYNSAKQYDASAQSKISTYKQKIENIMTPNLFQQIFGYNRYQMAQKAMPYMSDIENLQSSEIHGNLMKIHGVVRKVLGHVKGY